MGEPLVAARLRSYLANRGWNQADLVRATGIDKNTISDLLNGRRRPNQATVSRIEDALSLTPGTLGAPGEEVQQPEGSLSLASISDEELLTELTFRLTRAKREAAELRSALEEPPGEYTHQQVEERAQSTQEEAASETLPATTRDDFRLAARTGASRGVGLREALDAHDHDSQDLGYDDPA